MIELESVKMETCIHDAAVTSLCVVWCVLVLRPCPPVRFSVFLFPCFSFFLSFSGRLIVCLYFLCANVPFILISSILFFTQSLLTALDDQLTQEQEHLQRVQQQRQQLGLCTRSGCTNMAIDSPGWDKEYCSNECCVAHCRLFELRVRCIQ